MIKKTVETRFFYVLFWLCLNLYLCGGTGGGRLPERMFFSFSWNNVNCSPVKTFLSDSFLACINLSASAFSLSESIGGGGGGGGGESFITVFIPVKKIKNIALIFSFCASLRFKSFYSFSHIILLWSSALFCCGGCSAAVFNMAQNSSAYSIFVFIVFILFSSFFLNF